LRQIVLNPSKPIDAWGARAARRIPTLALVASVAACAVGPPYVKPEPPNISGYTARPLSASMPAVATGTPGAQRLQYGENVPPKWWKSFGSPALDDLMTRALAHNLELEAARQTLQQAQYNLEALQGVFYPQVSAGLSGSRSRTSGAESGGRVGSNIFNLYTGQVSVSYFPDVFGLNRLLAQNAQAQIDVARDQLFAAQLAIEGNAATAALQLAGLDARIDATEKTIADQKAVLDLIEKQYRFGAASQLQVATQKSQVASTEAQLPALQLEQDKLRHLLATLAGDFPAQAQKAPALQLSALQLPPTVPVSLPSSLVRARPDILAAEAQLRAANAQVGEAVAQMYPQVTLTGSFGGESNRWHDLFDPASRIWSLAAAAAAPLFAGGTLTAQKHAAQAAYRAVFADYQNTVLGAFRDVADALRALERDAAALDAQARALQAAQTGFALARQQYEAGAVDYLNLLTSEVQYQNARIAYVGAETQRYTDTVALYVALGGGAIEAGNAAVKTKEN
jgi:NodT family efflux transporter outer membrane factor (OMF) lipoprotein